MTDYTAEQLKEVTDVIGLVPRVGPDNHGNICIYPTEFASFRQQLHPDDLKTLTEKALDVFLEEHGVTGVYKDEGKKAWGATVDGELPKCLHTIDLPDGVDIFEVKLIMAKALKHADNL